MIKKQLPKFSLKKRKNTLKRLLTQIRQYKAFVKSMSTKTIGLKLGINALHLNFVVILKLHKKF